MLTLLPILAIAVAAPPPMAHPANARLAAAVARVQVQRGEPRQEHIATVQSAAVWPSLHATTWRAGKRCAGGPFSPKRPGVALPSKALLGTTVLVRSCKTGKIVQAPVCDTGPWSTQDAFVQERRRPWSESGKSDRYPRARNKAGIDLTPGLVRALGHGDVNPDTYSCKVDLIVITDTVLPTGD